MALVRRGYDAVSWRYRSDDAEQGRYGPWITALGTRLPARARVLDLGCGCGVPVARSLARAGHQVIGVDLSAVQLRRARRLVPQATFLQADATSVAFSPAVFDAVVCLYVLIHLPLAEQPGLIRRMATWLRSGGWLLATTGHTAWTGIQDDWLGRGAPMWWSHADAATYAAWLTKAGIAIEHQKFIPEATGGHALFWAHQRDRGLTVALGKPRDMASRH